MHVSTELKLLLKDILDHYGREHQLQKFREEAAELFEAIDSYLISHHPADASHMFEEFFDVIAVGIQLCISSSISEDLAKSMITSKAKRQLRRIVEGTDTKERKYDQP